MKLVVIEDEHEFATAVFGNADISASSRLAYVECHSAIARAQRDGVLNRSRARQARVVLDEIWTDMAVIELDADLAAQASRMTYEHSLRAADAIHLASSIVFADQDLRSLNFACWDDRLRAAAETMGLILVPENF